MELQLADIVRRVQAGDPAAFAALYEQTQQFIYYTALKYMGNPQDAEDAMQLIYIRVWNGVGGLKDPQSAPKWLHTITANTCRNELKRLGRAVTGLEQGEDPLAAVPEDDIAFLPEEALDREATRDIIIQIIDSLPEKQRATVYLYYFNELRVEEIAAQLGVSPGTVKSRLNSARLKIRDAVVAEEKRGVKLYAAPVLLRRVLTLDARNYRPSPALSAAILRQAEGLARPASAPEPPAGAPGGPPASPSGVSGDPPAPLPDVPGDPPASLSGAAKGGMHLAAKLGAGIVAAALLGGAALLLRQGGPPAAPPTAPEPTAAAQEPVQTPEEPAAEPPQNEEAFTLPPVGGLTYTDVFDDGAGYLHVVIPDAPPALCTLHLYAAPSITQEDAARVIADCEASGGWGNDWIANETRGNEGGDYVPALRHPDETGGSPFDLLVVSFDEGWHAVGYDILHVTAP